MSIFKKARKAIRKEVNQGIDRAKQRINSEIGSTINRINGFLDPNGEKRTFETKGKDSLQYPLVITPEDIRTDRTTYWLNVTINKQIGVETLENFGSSEQGRINTSVATRGNKNVIHKSIWLYLPQMQQADGMNYESKDLGFAGRSAAAAMQSARGGEGIADAIGAAAAEQIDQAASTLQDIFTKGTVPSIGTIAAGVGLTKDLPVLSQASDAVSFATGISKDPHTITLFRGVNIRTHSFDFNFVPENEREAQEVEKIIRAFREAMYPISVTTNEASGGDEPGGIDIAYIFPNSFTLNAYSMDPETFELRNLSSKGLFYKDCVLTECTTNFDPSNSMSQRPGGYFPQSTLSLSFSEIETLKRSDITNAYERRES